MIGARHAPHHRRAFTLIEVMVVMVIVAILAGLSFGGLSYMSRRGENTKCVQNLRNMYTGLQSYTADNNGLLPQMVFGKSAKTDPGATLDSVLGDRGMASETFHCPGDRKGTYEASGCSYFWIYGLAVKADGTPLDHMNNLNLMTLDDPVSIPFIMDKDKSFHGGKSHVVYADGHAE